jgi:mRNA interferase RelE/StbE
MYRIRILEAATRELARLDKPVGRRIVERINWLAANHEIGHRREIYRK